MPVDKDFLLAALLQHNYLPIQRVDKEELPRVFSTEALTPKIATALVAGTQRKEATGFDSVEYRLTRFNGVARCLSIPHPLAHAQLALCIHEHWEKLDFISSNQRSHIKPQQYSDGRVIVMDYENPWEKSELALNLGFGRRFTLHADIANCFPSIYSHSVPWAAVGFEEAKSKKGKKHQHEWFNQLDEKLRMTRRNETQGISIGPATSNVISEIVLARVDEALGPDTPYVRYIDDYRAYCRTEEEAQEFQQRLARELGKFKLLLNGRKTEILPLPQPVAPAWLSQLALALPKGEAIRGTDAVHFLNLALQLAGRSGEGNVLKYALKALSRQAFAQLAELQVIPYALTLAFHNPSLLPLLSTFFESAGFFMIVWRDELRRLAHENARLARSDGMVWCLYLMATCEIPVDDELADAVVGSRDCMAILMLHHLGSQHHQQKVIDFVKSLNVDDIYELDQYWILLYQLHLTGLFASPYKCDTSFEILAQHGVSFVTPLAAKAS